MRYQIQTLLTCILLILLSLAAEAADLTATAPISGPAGTNSELYWLTFSGDCSCDGIFVMQIDALGNVTRSPKAVLTIAQWGAGASALGKNGPTKLNLWHWKSSTFLIRAVIDKASLNTTGNALTFSYSAENEFVQVSQKGSKDVLLAEAPSGSLRTFPLLSNGIPSNAPKDVVPALKSESDEASISADGLAVVTNRGVDDPNTPTSDQLFFQLLDENGAAKGAPTLIAGFKDIEAVDVTNALDQGKRYVVYTVDTGTVPDDKLYLQVVNEAGKKVGGHKTINVPPNRDEDAQTVAIDPFGKFVVFTM